MEKNNIDFYNSDAWRSLRYEAIKKYPRRCMACSAEGVELHVDHIKPRSINPELELDIDNLQILCRDCNLGKGNSDSVDWRPGRRLLNLTDDELKVFLDGSDLTVEQRQMLVKDIALRKQSLAFRAEATSILRKLRDGQNPEGLESFVKAVRGLCVES